MPLPLLLCTRMVAYARDTVDELVLARIETKREVQDLLLEAMRRRGLP